MSELSDLDKNFNMESVKLWMFPDMLKDNKVQGHFIEHEILEENEAGQKYKKPMLVLHLKLDEPLPNDEFNYDEFKVSFWTLNSKNRKMMPSEIIKGNKFILSKDNQKIDITEVPDTPYVEEVDVK